jgi:hypothetical protein
LNICCPLTVGHKLGWDNKNIVQLKLDVGVARMIATAHNRDGLDVAYGDEGMRRESGE